MESLRKSVKSLRYSANFSSYSADFSRYGADLFRLYRGLLALKHKFTAKPFAKKDETGKPIPREQLANYSAKQLKKDFLDMPHSTG